MPRCWSARSLAWATCQAHAAASGAPAAAAAGEPWGCCCCCCLGAAAAGEGSAAGPACGGHTAAPPHCPRRSWNMGYPFNTGDLLCCGQLAANYLDASSKARAVRGRGPPPGGAAMTGDGAGGSRSRRRCCHQWGPALPSLHLAQPASQPCLPCCAPCLPGALGRPAVPDGRDHVRRAHRGGLVRLPACLRGLRGAAGLFVALPLLLPACCRWPRLRSGRSRRGQHPPPCSLPGSAGTGAWRPPTCTATLASSCWRAAPCSPASTRPRPRCRTRRRGPVAGGAGRQAVARRQRCRALPSAAACRGTVQRSPCWPHNCAALPPSLPPCQVLEYIEDSMPAESAAAFGLHPNAEIGFKLREASAFCANLQALQARRACCWRAGMLMVQGRRLWLFALRLLACQSLAALLVCTRRLPHPPLTPSCPSSAAAA